MSGAAISWAKRQLASSKTAKALLIALGDYADQAGWAWPAVETMAAELQISDRSVQRAYRQLAAEGLLVEFRVYDRSTGRQRTNAYWYPLTGSFPTSDVIAKYERDVGGRVTPMSPPEGDTHVTGEGDTRVRGRVTAVSPLKEPLLEPERTDVLSSGERAPEAGDLFTVDPFWRAVDAYHPSARTAFDEPAARDAWTAALRSRRIGGDAERLIEAARRWSASWSAKPHDYDAPAFQRFLSRGAWHGFLPEPEWRPGGRADHSGSPAAQPFAGPNEVRDLAIRLKGQAWFGSWVATAAWDEAGRVLTPRGPTALAKLQGERLFLRELTELGVSIGDPQQNPAKGREVHHVERS